MGMAADDNFLHPQGRDRIFNGCDLAACGRAVGRDNVARITEDEQLAWI
jgi:hypothetical protein